MFGVGTGVGTGMGAGMSTAQTLPWNANAPAVGKTAGAFFRKGTSRYQARPDSLSISSGSLVAPLSAERAKAA